MPVSAERLVSWAAALLLGGGVVALCAGGLLLIRSRQASYSSYFRLRRQTVLRAWKYLVWGVLLLVGAGLTAGLGPAVTRWASPSGPSAIPALTAAAPAVNTPAPLASATTAAETATAPAALTASAPAATSGPALLVNMTPGLPLARRTPPAGTLTVTPPAAAIIANLRLSRFNDCSAQRGVAETFTSPPKTLYALFDYDGWLPGAEWSDVWLYNGAVVAMETLLWDGSTGGCGFAEFDNAGQPWAAGVYTVWIFSGEQWLGTATFTISDQTPDPSATP